MTLTDCGHDTRTYDQGTGALTHWCPTCGAYREVFCGRITKEGQDDYYIGRDMTPNQCRSWLPDHAGAHIGTTDCAIYGPVNRGA